MASLLADENVHPLLIDALRAEGHDVATVAGSRLKGADDDAVLEEANRAGRILVTADKDFGLILESGPLAGRGRVLLLRYKVLHWTRIAQDLSTVLRSTERDYADDPRLLVVLSEGHYRVRHASAPPPHP
jgi:predicted nuclease of predicted toxin-antitoxin system